LISQLHATEARSPRRARAVGIAATLSAGAAAPRRPCGRPLQK
jgi:hypothetical protein